MRIQSNFRDYYDTLQQHSVNPELVYRRYPSEITDQYNYRFILNCSYNEYFIGFCGKIYPVVQIHTGKSWETDKEFRKNCVFCFTQKEVEMAQTIKNKNKERYSYSSWDLDKQSIYNFFNHNIRDKELRQYFNYNTPLFVLNVKEHKIILNSPLKQLEFYRLFDMTAAYQEVMMWLNNQAAPIKPIPQPDDLTMCEIKGFDTRYSFRKPKRSG